MPIYPDDVIASGADLGPLKKAIKNALESFSDEPSETTKSKSVNSKSATPDDKPIDPDDLEATLLPQFKRYFDIREGLLAQAGKSRTS
jgi:hypothetical protein